MGSLVSVSNLRIHESNNTSLCNAEVMGRRAGFQDRRDNQWKQLTSVSGSLKCNYIFWKWRGMDLFLFLVWTRVIYVHKIVYNSPSKMGIGYGAINIIHQIFEL